MQFPSDLHIHMFRCRNSNVVDFGMLPQTPMEMLRNIRRMRRATFLKSQKILNSEIYLAPKSFGLWTVDCGSARQ